MAYGLPTRGQADWDDELNNSVENLRAKADGATAKADNAVSTANSAANLALAADARSRRAASGVVGDVLGEPFGAAELDSSGRLPEGQVPDRLTESSLNATFVGTPAGVADGEVPVWDADTSTWVAGVPGNPGLEGRVDTLEATTVTNEEVGIVTTVLDPATIAATRSQAFLVSPTAGTLEQIGFTFRAAIAASDVDYWTLVVKRNRWGTETTIATKTTQTTGGEPIAANRPWTFDAVTWTADAAEIIKDDVIIVTATPTGAPAALDGPAITARILPADPAAPMMVVDSSDSFDRADGALGTADTGETWELSSAVWVVDGNLAKLNTSALGTRWAVLESGRADCTIEVTIAATSSIYSMGIAYRHASTSQRWEVAHNALYVRDTSATLKANLAETFVAGDRMRVVVSGDNHKVYRRAGNTGSWVLVADVTDATYNTATKHGLRMSDNDTGLNAFNEFVVYHYA